MKLKFTNDGRYIVVLEYTAMELKQLKSTLTEEGFSKRKRKVYTVCELNQIKGHYVFRAGHWKRVRQMQEMGYVIEFVNPLDFFHNIKKSYFNEWVASVDLPFDPYDYQTDAAFYALKYRICKSELDTGAGKTLFCYLVARFLYDHGMLYGSHQDTTIKEFKRYKKGKILFVVPTPSLVQQTAEEFDKFDADDSIVISTIYSGSKRVSNANIIIGNDASLVNCDEDFYKDIIAVVYDEGHKMETNRYRDIHKKVSKNILCVTHGCSGTFHPTNDALGLMAERVMGSTMIVKPSWELIDEDKLTPVHIDQRTIKHPEEIARLYYTDPKVKDKNKFFALETDVINSSQAKINYLIHTLKTDCSGNSILLGRRKEYLRDVQRQLKLAFPEKEVVLIIGDVKQKDRQEIIDGMRKDSNYIVVANYKCVDTGLSIKNLHNIILFESVKSWISLRQTIGRGLRLHESKDVFNLIDLVDLMVKPDDIKEIEMAMKPEDRTPTVNTRFYHGKARITIYNQRKMPYSKTNVDLAQFL